MLQVTSKVHSQILRELESWRQSFHSNFVSIDLKAMERQSLFWLRPCGRIEKKMYEAQWMTHEINFAQ